MDRLHSNARPHLVLAVEEHFYLLWPAVFWVILKTPVRLANLLISVITVVWVVRTALVTLHVIPPWTAYVLTWFRFDHLAIGCLLAVAVVYFSSISAGSAQ